MAEGTEVFHANITATDDVSKVANQIIERLQKLAGKMHDVEHAGAKLHQPRVWDLMRERAGEARENFAQLGEGVSGVGERITELLPALAGLGAVTSIAGAFETVERVSESFSKLAHSAEELGASARQLQVWHAVATLTDTDSEVMDKSLSRLNRTFADVTRGKAKDAAALLSHIRLDPRHYRTGADALFALADAFQRTVDPKKRNSMAHVLMGRGGDDLVPMLSKGGAALHKAFEEAGAKTFDPTGTLRGMQEYTDSMKQLRLSVGAFGDEIGAKLAPVLRPIVDEFGRWVDKNRDFIATKIVDEVKQLEHWLEVINWDDVGRKAEVWGDRIEHAGKAVGGLTGALEILGGMMIANAALNFAAKALEVGAFTAKITGLSFAWEAVAAAAKSAGADEQAALANAVAGKVTGGASVVGPGLGAARLVGKGLGFGVLAGMAALDAQSGVDISLDDVRDRPELAKRLTPSQLKGLPKHRGLEKLWADYFGDPEPDGFIGAADLASPTSIGFRTAKLPQIPALSISSIDERQGGPRQSNSIDVKVHFENAPKGMTATATANGPDISGQPQVNVGQAWADQYGRR